MAKFQNLFKIKSINQCSKIFSQRLLEWIKAIKERHGSVEESSMTTVTQINTSGVFTIDVHGIKVEFKQLENSSNDEIAKRVFDKEECDELRSKLMLITTGAEGKILVNRFVSLFGLVEQLFSNLAKLTSSGCHLFSKWKATVYCAKDRKVSMIVDYGSSSAGLIQGNKDVETELEQSVAFLNVSFCNHSYNQIYLQMIFRRHFTRGKFS